jgi:hypothetical protein
VVGYGDGSVEVMPGAGAPLVLVGTPSSVPMRIVAGPTGTILVGYAGGFVGLWDRRTGARLDHWQLHGATHQLAFAAGKLYAVSELGQDLVEDLGVFEIDRCALLARVWRDVPVEWASGLPVLAPPPTEHACARR